MRREFEMTEAQLQRLLKACRPVPYIVAGGMPPQSPQANANAAWGELGRELGFEPMSAKPVPGKGQRFFTAEATGDAKGNSDD
jgi:hypothetical protein